VWDGKLVGSQSNSEYCTEEINPSAPTRILNLPVNPELVTLLAETLQL
jgi:hypothetical protein